MVDARGVASLNVVVVEDNPDTRDTIVTMVRDLGHAVAAFETAEDALQHLATNTAHVLVADLFLPGMSGELFGLAARGSQPALAIVFVTGSGALPNLSNDGTNTVLLRKPFSLSALEGAFNTVAPEMRPVTAS